MLHKNYFDYFWLCESLRLCICVFSMADLNSSDIWRHFAHIFPSPHFYFFCFAEQKTKKKKEKTKKNSKAAYKIEKCLRGCEREREKKNKNSASCQSFMDWHMAHQQVGGDAAGGVAGLVSVPVMRP